MAQYTDNVTIAYDSDGPGPDATRRAVGLLGEVGVKIRVLSMSGAKDPDEYIKKFGAERFGLLIEGASNATEFEIAKLKQSYDTDTADGKVGFLREFVKLMAGVPNAIERDVYIAKTAADLEVDKAAIAAQLTYERKRAAKKQKRDAGDLKVYSEVRTPSQKQDFQRARNIKYALAEDKLLAILMKIQIITKRSRNRSPWTILSPTATGRSRGCSSSACKMGSQSNLRCFPRHFPSNRWASLQNCSIPYRV